MTDQPQPETRSFGSVLNDLELTPAEAAHLLSRWAAELRDSFPALHSKLTEHAANLSTPAEPVEQQSATPTDTTFYDEPTQGEPAPVAPMAEGRPATQNPQTVPVETGGPVPTESPQPNA